jgi:NadR type nicotinamide-nucleotide adenylyltransferase
VPRDGIATLGANVDRRPTTVVVTGSESTGKTTLAGDLARELETVCVPEFARTYLDTQLAIGRALDATDVEPIAHGEIAAIEAATPNARRVLVLDTDLVSTVVYARHYYGSCPSWIEQAARERLGDLYLLCNIDVPWVPAPFRDRPHHRAEIHGLFADTLASFGARVVLVHGSWAERWTSALAAVRQALMS